MNEADFYDLIRRVEDHRDEIETWLPLITAPIDGRDPVGADVVAEVKALVELVDVALVGRDLPDLQKAEAAYQACSFFIDPPALFETGEVVMTPAARDLGVDLEDHLTRHKRGDWGDLVKEDKASNDEALKTGDEILSRYDTPKGSIYIHTEPDRSATTIMLSSEY